MRRRRELRKWLLCELRILQRRYDRLIDLNEFQTGTWKNCFGQRLVKRGVTNELQDQVIAKPIVRRGCSQSHVNLGVRVKSAR
jgi:hypothetical protein